jgi:CRP/FNR family transcriptional regulator, cyclic AMP receptor protein
MTTTRLVEQSRIFEGLDQQELNSFLEIFQKIKVSAGDVVFHEGDIGNILYIVENGTVSLKRRITADVEKKLFVAKEGLLFGEFSFMDGGIRSADAVVEEDSDLLSLERKDFDNFIGLHQKIGLVIFNNLLQIVVDRLRQTNEAYRDAIRWGLDLTGTTVLNFHYLITENVAVSIELISGRTIEGKVLQLETSDAGFQIIMKDHRENTVILPYHAVVSVTVAE